MTTEELIQNLYEGSYEQDELNPYNDLGVITETVSGCRDIIKYINRALRIVSMWKFPNGVRIRFKANNGIKYLNTPETGKFYWDTDSTGQASYDAGYVLAADAITEPSSYVVHLPASFAKPNDYYRGWVLTTIRTGSFFVVGSHDNVLQLDKRITAVDGNNDVFYLCPSQLTIGDGADYALDLDGFISVVDIFDRDANYELQQTRSHEFPTRPEITTGAPAEYYHYGDRLYFDKCIGDSRSLMVRYYRYPRMVERVADRIDLPEAFHDAVFLAAKTELLRRIGEATEAYSTWESLRSLMITLRSELDFEHENDSSRIYPEA